MGACLSQALNCEKRLAVARVMTKLALYEMIAVASFEALKPIEVVAVANIELVPKNIRARIAVRAPHWLQAGVRDLLCERQNSMIRRVRSSGVRRSASICSNSDSSSAE